MSQDDLETIVGALELWSRGDEDGAIERLTPDVEWHHNIGGGTPLEGVYRGRAEVRELWAEIRASFDEVRFDFERVSEHGDAVLVLGSMRLRGTGSGAAVATPFGVVAEFEGGRISRQWLWTDQARALEAISLSS